MRFFTLLGLSALSLWAQSSVYSGHWTLDRSASPSSGIESEGAADLRIADVAAQTLRITYKASRSTIDLDGYDHPTGQNEEFAAATPLRAALLVCYWKGSSEGPVAVIELWRISSDGNTLTRHRQHPGNEAPDPTLVYRRVAE